MHYTGIRCISQRESDSVPCTWTRKTWKSCIRIFTGIQLFSAT